MSIPTSLLFYDADGNVVGTLDYMVRYDDDGVPIGLVDFEAHELSGGRLREIVEHGSAVGAGTWPEWLGASAHDFKVQVRPGAKGGTHLIRSLQHSRSGYRRERSDIESALSDLISGTGPGDVVNVSGILGGPGKHLILDEDGRTAAAVVPVKPDLPVLPASGLARSSFRDSRSSLEKDADAVVESEVPVP